MPCWHTGYIPAATIAIISGFCNLSDPIQHFLMLGAFRFIRGVFLIMLETTAGHTL